MSEDLKRKCDALSLEDKIDLRDYISASINRNECLQSGIRCSILLGEIGDVIGRKVDYFHRDPMDVWARAMVAYQMTLEGYSTIEIGRQMMKDHSTVIYLRNKMKDAFEIPNAYRDILQIWNDFQKRIKL